MRLVNGSDKINMTDGNEDEIDDTYKWIKENKYSKIANLVRI